MTAKEKKPFITDIPQIQDAPEFAFISREQKPTAEPSEIPEGYKVNPEYIEKRSRRLQLVLQPSLYAKIQEKAQRENKSVNDLIHSILAEAMKGE